MNSWKKMLESKRIKVLMIGVITLVANDVMGWGISPEAIDRFCVLVLGYVGAQSISDIGKGRVEAENGHAKKKPGT